MLRCGEEWCCGVVPCGELVDLWCGAVLRGRCIVVMRWQWCGEQLLMLCSEV